MLKPDILLTGLAFGESARWHDDRFWFANWGPARSTRWTRTGATRSC